MPGARRGRALVAAGEARGLVRERCLESTGLGPADLDDPDLLIEAAQELQVMRNLVARVGDKAGLGAEVGRRARLGSFGMWGYAIPHQPDARRCGEDRGPVRPAVLCPVGGIAEWLTACHADG